MQERRHLIPLVLTSNDFFRVDLRVLRAEATVTGVGAAFLLDRVRRVPSNFFYSIQFVYLGVYVCVVICIFSLNLYEFFVIVSDAYQFRIYFVFRIYPPRKQKIND